MDKNIFIKQLDVILEEFKELTRKSKFDDLSGTPLEWKTVLIGKSKASIVRIAGIHSEYNKEIERILEKPGVKIGSRVRQIIGIVQALRDDLNNDYLKSVAELIHSEVFADYLEMSTYLLSEGYKDASAVIVGSTLESHLKKLCDKNFIDKTFTNSKGKIISKKADTMNAELSKEGVYNKTYQKQITAWLGLRNDAAHGNYSEYQEAEVKLMISGISQFVLQYPA
ncbi:MAG: hypothetical protein HWE07_13495 [Cytophagia bacterium]|nr:hypothetical protein [Cytophagia bacterium]